MTEPRRDTVAELLAGVDAVDHGALLDPAPDRSSPAIVAQRLDRARAALHRLEGHDPVGEFPAHYFEQDDPREED